MNGTASYPKLIKVNHFGVNPIMKSKVQAHCKLCVHFGQCTDKYIHQNKS